ncbi:MAG: SulP family inorganic anion transporter [Cytophagales bacterium]
MKLPFAKHFKRLKKYWQNELIAGLTVALVALPLAMGISLACGLPVTSGIFSVLVGGLVISHINGAHLTVNGPPKATIIVILTAIASFGGGLQGVEIVIAAFFIVGVFMFLFGLFKFGELGDFFPSSAIQGMLSAIGIMIILNQMYILFGLESTSHDPFEIILHIPDLINDINPYVAVIGFTSLSFLFIYPYLEGKLIRLIPAPMWVVFYASIMAFLFNFGTERTITIAGNTHNIGPYLMISLPDSLIGSVISPNFSQILNIEFWMIVLNITFIASLESLLSARAVDKLDPERRSTNLNQNLMATGGGTMLSSLLGGLPVISMILPSTVAVNTGARTSWTNFFQGLSILILVVFLSGMLNRIPLAALAAILVHTGYKLASIKVFKRTYQYGREQLIIFLITLCFTLFFDIVIGICAGIIATLIIHSFAGIEKRYLFSFLFKSTNHFHYDEEDDHYFISVRRFANFFNYLGLKKELNKVPPKKHLILDFSHARLIDHTVMEHVTNFARKYRDKGGVFEIVGLDLHKPSSNHPLAGRRIVEGYTPSARKYNITRRQRQIKRVTYRNNWEFTIDTDWDISHLRMFPFFENKLLHYQNNVIKGDIKGQEFQISDVAYAEGAMEASVDKRMTIMIQNLEALLPKFTLQREVAIDKVLTLAGLPDIDFKAFPGFSSKFLLQGNNEEAIRELFNKELIIFFEMHSIFHIECNGYQLLLFEKTNLAKPHDIEVMTEFVKQLWSRIQ